MCYMERINDMIQSMDNEKTKGDGMDTLQRLQIDLHCPNCYSIIDAWACKLVCRNCGVSFTCDE